MIRLLRHLAYDGPRHHPTHDPNTDRCEPAPADPDPDTPALPTWLTEWTSGAGLQMHSPSRHTGRSSGPELGPWLTP